MKITKVTETTVLDGTPEELAVYNAIGLSEDRDAAPSRSRVPQAAPEALEDSQDSDERKTFVTEDVAGKVLRRRPLSNELRIVLVALYKAHPSRVTSLELQRLTGYSGRQLAGLMGAFGRRLAHTPGHRSGDQFFDWAWTAQGWEYGIPESVVVAIRVMKLV